MSSVATISAAGGLLTSFLNKPKAPKELPSNNFNAYGENNTQAKGAIESRDSIFSDINSPGFQSLLNGSSEEYAGSLRDAAHSPLLNQAKGYTSDVLGGGYLESPTVKRFADQAYNSIVSQGRDQDVRTEAQYANNGIGFSSGMQQAQRANRAATAGQAATARSGILADNYKAERQMQQGAVGNAESLASQTPQYLSQINSALFAPYTARAGLTTGLLGSPTASPQPTYVAQPTAANQIATGTSTAAGLYSILNAIKAKSGGGSAGNSNGVPTAADWDPYGVSGVT